MITGVCLATLVRDGKVTFAMPMRDALAQFFKRHGRPADRRFEDVTVEQLLTHRSGLAGNRDGDPLHQDLAGARRERAGASGGAAAIAGPTPQEAAAARARGPVRLQQHRIPGVDRDHRGEVRAGPMRTIAARPCSTRLGIAQRAARSGLAAVLRRRRLDAFPAPTTSPCSRSSTRRTAFSVTK